MPSANTVAFWRVRKAAMVFKGAAWPMLAFPSLHVRGFAGPPRLLEFSLSGEANGEVCLEGIHVNTPLKN